MRILSGLMLGMLMLMACRQAEPAASPAESHPAAGRDSLQPPATLALSAQAQAVIEGWAAFNNLQQRMETLFRTQRTEDLELLLEELVEACKELETSEFPEGFDRPSLRSRLKVLRTFLQKTQADLHYRLDPRESLYQVAGAHNAFRQQLNREAAVNLDPTIFDDE